MSKINQNITNNLWITHQKLLNLSDLDLLLKFSYHSTNKIIHLISYNSSFTHFPPSIISPTKQRSQNLYVKNYYS